MPFIFYGLAFFLVGMVPYASGTGSKAWIQYVATGFYAVASASGSLFFVLNFGSEGMLKCLIRCSTMLANINTQVGLLLRLGHSEHALSKALNRSMSVFFGTGETILSKRLRMVLHRKVCLPLPGISLL